MNKTRLNSRSSGHLIGWAVFLLAGPALPCGAQETSSSTLAPAGSDRTLAAAPAAEESELIELSPFVVEATEDEGYLATSTLAGTRLRTSLRDVGSAISVVTEQFLTDTASVRAEDLLVYTTNTEIGGVSGNTSGLTLGRSTDETPNLTAQNLNQRIRGLSGADNTRDFFLTDIPWDSYNTGRVDMQRGPNSILFGLGSPAGVVNAGINQANFKTGGRIEARFDEFGTKRGSLDYNHVLIRDELAVRLAVLHDDTKYRQDPAFNTDKRYYGALRFDPKFLKFGDNARGTFRINYEQGKITAARPRVLPPIDRITPWFAEGTYTVPANPDFNKPAATYNALNRRVFNNWDIENYRSWVPGSGTQNQDGRVWINPTNRTQTTYEWTRSTPTSYVQIGSRPDFAGVGATPTERGEWLYEPWVSEWYNSGVLAFFDGASNPNSPNALYAISNRTVHNGIDRFGRIDGNIDAFPYSVTQAITEPWKYAKGTSLPFQSAYRDPNLTDPNVFDFHNHLFDGNTRRSWRNFNVVSMALDETFFNNRVGLSLSYDHQRYEDGYNAVVSERNQAINVDVNATYAANNLPNPNAGRAMILGGGSSGGRQSEREEKRATLFGELRGTDVFKTSWIGKMLGRHVFTGMVSENDYRNTSLGWKRWMLDPSIMSIYSGGLPNTTAGGNNPTTSNSGLEFTPVIYLSGDMRDRSAYPNMSSLNLSTPTTFRVPDSVNLTYFDSRWNRSLNPADANRTGSQQYINPNGLWINPFSQDPREPAAVAIRPTSVSTSAWNALSYANKLATWNALPQAEKDALIAATPDEYDHYIGTGKSRQSENPANYVGWRSTTVPLLDGEDPGERKHLMTSVNLSRMNISTKAFVWQGNLLDGVVVPTFGWRKDTAKAYSYQASSIAYGKPDSVRTQDGRIIADSPLIRLPDSPYRVRDFQNRSWSVVLHTPNFIRERMPWGTNLSLSYNTSSNFNPQDAARSDLFGREMAPSSGTTRDVGLHLSTWNDKVSFRVIKFETKNKDVSIGGSPIGDIKMAEVRAWVMAKRLQAGLADPIANQGSGFNIGGPDTEDVDADGNTSEFYQSPADRAKQVAIVDAVLGNLPTEFFKAWQIDVNSDIWRTSWDPGTQPAGVTAIQDRSSKGWEYELTVRPVQNWSITGNYSKTEAVTDNNYNNLIPFVEERTPHWAGIAGQVPYPNGNPSSEKQGNNWEQHVIGKMSAATAVNGEKQQEMVPRRLNLISTYRFTSGFLKGLTVGGGYRWEDKAAIGYQYTYANLYGQLREVKDLSKPFYGRTLTNIDAWVAYETKISDKVRYTIQLNVRNLGDDNTVVPIGANPDGSLSQWRIKEGQSWSITNTLRF